jgi:hypothetical protein
VRYDYFLSGKGVSRRKKNQQRKALLILFS